MPFGGRDPVKIQWYLEGEELSDESNIRIEHTEGHSRLLLNKLQRKDSGEVKIKIKNEFGTTEAVTQLIVLGECYSQENYSVILRERLVLFPRKMYYYSQGKEKPFSFMLVYCTDPFPMSIVNLRLGPLHSI